MSRWVHFYPRQCAMYGAIEFETRRWGYITILPPIYALGCWRPWGICVSPNATPWAATFLAGPAHYEHEKREAAERRRRWGHGYSTSEHDPQADS